MDENTKIPKLLSHLKLMHDFNKIYDKNIKDYFHIMMK